jgi:hypothetical protein
MLKKQNDIAKSWRTGAISANRMQKYIKRESPGAKERSYMVFAFI